MDDFDYSEYSCGTHLLEDELFLSRCQIDTPFEIVKLFWSLVDNYREQVGTVVDLGAGDGRFALHGSYSSYTGYEIDQSRLGSEKLPVNAQINMQCAFAIKGNDFDACIGNPPYVKHHDIDDPWQERVSNQIEYRLNISIKRTANLFSLFLLQGIAVTKANGLVAQIIPYEWVSRPSTKPIRDIINRQGWSVSIYRFKSTVFPRVLTTACVTIIDKASQKGSWSYYEIGADFVVTPVRRLTGTRYNVLAYSKREEVNFAQRGLSPGGNKIFCLTEGERLHHGLKKGRDVMPCLTSLKPLPSSQKALNQRSFDLYYVRAGARCWLISNTKKPSCELKGYLASVPEAKRSNYTCQNQSPWWNYKSHLAPDIVYNPGFVTSAPQFVDNQVCAVAVGSVFGIHRVTGISKRLLIHELSNFEFRSRLVSYANVLRRVEVNQMNTVIHSIVKRTN